MTDAVESTRSIVLARLTADVIGPKSGRDEVLDESPSERYLTGILYPQGSEFSEEDDDAIDDENVGSKSDQDTDDSLESVSLFRSFKPATCGVSFTVRIDEPDAKLNLRVSFGIYKPLEDVTDISSTKKAKAKTLWKRHSIEPENIEIEVQAAGKELPIYHGLTYFKKISIVDDLATVTLQFINKYCEESEASKGERQRAPADESLVVSDKRSSEMGTFFQFEANIECAGCAFVPRPQVFFGNDEDGRIADLIYRDQADYAVGHTSSVVWTPTKSPQRLSLSWIPTAVVRRMDADGDPLAGEHLSRTKLSSLDAMQFATSSVKDVVEALRALANGYSEWIDERRREVGTLPDPVLIRQAKLNLERCGEALTRIRGGINLLESDPIAFEAFRLANRAMYIQAAWSKNRPLAHRETMPSLDFALKWRPFQIAFALLCFSGAINRHHPDRGLFDLIWFPTGGGKTEAYLLLAAFVIFYRRLAFGKRGAGVAVLMRYTLRTLTVQQFQRAAALITACEQLRQDRFPALGDAAFSIGLWVGNESTPNRYDDAAKSLTELYPKSTPKLITRCPACGTPPQWRADVEARAIICECTSEQCRSDRTAGRIPVLTVDDDLYERPPSFLIGTVDKFAQLPRNQRIGALFGVGGQVLPPDLIIQDELHLISGPLGSLTGIYEVAVDMLCTNGDGPPKVVGSTATIRRAAQQIRQVFDRSAFQFPPPGLEAKNSFFARQDDGDEGRLYVGISSAGRSEKFALQAVAASLLQAVKSPNLVGEVDVDGYFTLVAYFNSLKVLGGALVLMEDDVRRSIDAYALQRGEQPRQLGTPEELTSRKASAEIPVILERLNKVMNDEDCIDVLLASNMLSVGVDIPRLGLMLMSGQPKYMSEYIQATSRVGRTTPGLVVTVYNSNKIRDRAHFEAFSSWHGALYRSVEPAGTTPFAPRARDKAIHAPFVALVRLLLSPASPRLMQANEAEMRRILDKIVKRVEAVDEQEAQQTREELETFLLAWRDGVDAGRITDYWSDYKFNKSLLMSAEAAAARRALGRGDAPAIPTPNSVRNVEPSVAFVLRERP